MPRTLHTHGVYPPDWREIADDVKARAEFRCIRCHHANDLKSLSGDAQSAVGYLWLHGGRMNDEIRILEQELAYSAARSDIECFCTMRHWSGPYIGTWYDTAVDVEEEHVGPLQKAVRYLEARKLLRRHPQNSTLVRPIDAPANS